MLAHRVGTIGAIVAVVILSVELLGAIAWKHHVVAAPTVAQAKQLHATLVR